MKKIIMDCDVGVDDALALILAFHSPELQVEAVTGVSGNVPLDTVFENIKRVLALIRPDRKPLIARGAENPLRGEPYYAHSVHGEDGLGNARLSLPRDEEWWQLDPGQAHELISKIARKYEKEVSLIAIGPLTNLAMGFQTDPEGMSQLKELIIMGGAVRAPGNVTPYAEFNFFVDPLAARIVLKSGLPITLVPLDITHQVFLTSATVEEVIRPRNDPFSRFAIEVLGYDFQMQKFAQGMPAVYLHDPLAVAAVLDPQLIRTEKVAIDVETRAGQNYGQVFEIPAEKIPESAKVKVGLKVEAEKFLDLFIHHLLGLGDV